MWLGGLLTDPFFILLLLGLLAWMYVGWMDGWMDGWMAMAIGEDM